jgi:hypothetical protein
MTSETPNGSAKRRKPWCRSLASARRRYALEHARSRQRQGRDQGAGGDVRDRGLQAAAEALRGHCRQQQQRFGDAPQ